jgi:hypothetical protein
MLDFLYVAEMALEFIARVDLVLMGVRRIHHLAKSVDVGLLLQLLLAPRRLRSDPFVIDRCARGAIHIAASLNSYRVLRGVDP